MAKETPQKPTEPTAEGGVFAVLIDGLVFLLFNPASQAVKDWDIKYHALSDRRTDAKAEFFFYDAALEAVKRIEETDARFATSRNRIAVDLEHQRNLITHALEAVTEFSSQSRIRSQVKAVGKIIASGSFGDSSTKEQTIETMVVRASEVLGSRDEGMRWLGSPVRGLDFATPISLLATPEGVEQVNDMLTRIEHGVW